MRFSVILFFLFLSIRVNCQELYVFTEPASNMATKSIGLRLNNYFLGEKNSSETDYHMIPEIMFGVTKKIMIHGDVFFSNRAKNFKAEGGSIYVKYRFFSNDDVQKHFRMAAFARVSINNSAIDQQEINLYGFNSGYEGGIVATQLLHKIALSSGISFVKATDNSNSNKFIYGEHNSKAINYTLSIGKLMLPKEYKDYKQANLNLMLEFLNQYNLGSGNYYIDIAPAAQVIINSVARIDVGYRHQLTSDLIRTSPNGLFVRLEYNFFNVW